MDIISVLKDKPHLETLYWDIFSREHPRLETKKPAVEPDNVDFQFVFKSQRLFSKNKRSFYNVCLDYDVEYQDFKNPNLKFKHFKLPKGFFRNTSKNLDSNYRGFLDYKFKGFKIRPSFIF